MRLFNSRCFDLESESFLRYPHPSTTSWMTLSSRRPQAIYFPLLSALRCGSDFRVDGKKKFMHQKKYKHAKSHTNWISSTKTPKCSTRMYKICAPSWENRMKQAPKLVCAVVVHKRQQFQAPTRHLLLLTCEAQPVRTEDDRRKLVRKHEAPANSQCQRGCKKSRKTVLRQYAGTPLGMPKQGNMPIRQYAARSTEAGKYVFFASAVRAVAARALVLLHKQASSAYL